MVESCVGIFSEVTVMRMGKRRSEVDTYMNSWGGGFSRQPLSRARE